MKHQEKEIYNTLTHLVGFFLSIVGLPFMITANQNLTPYSLFSILFFFFGLTFVYGASSLYHFKIDSPKSQFYRTIDHISIFYLIAGSYAPVCLITLFDGSGLMIFISIFSIALIGTIFKIYKTGKHEKFSLFIYLSMGWFILIDIDSVFKLLPAKGFFLLVLSGLLYTIGTYFYQKGNLKYSHTIWHIFVLAGSVAHYFAVLLFII